MGTRQPHHGITQFEERAGGKLLGANLEQTGAAVEECAGDGEGREPFPLRRLDVYDRLEPRQTPQAC